MNWRGWLFLGLVAVSQGVIAVDSSVWGEVASSANGDLHIYAKKGTFRNAGGSSSVLIQEMGAGKVWHNKASIKDKDCDNGYGVVSYYQLNGKLDDREEFVADGESMNDALGDFICGIRLLLKSPSVKS